MQQMVRGLYRTTRLDRHRIFNDTEIVRCRSPYQSAIIRTELMSAKKQFREGPLLAEPGRLCSVNWAAAPADQQSDATDCCSAKANLGALTTIRQPHLSYPPFNRQGGNDRLAPSSSEGMRAYNRVLTQAAAHAAGMPREPTASRSWLRSFS